MSGIPPAPTESPAAAAPAAPARRRRRWPLVALLLLAIGALALAALVASSPALRWSARASFAPAPDALAWQSVPGGRPIVAVLDVQALMGSPLAAALRADLEQAARSQGFDLALAEGNARLLVMTSDGRGFASGTAAGPKLSPLLLPRFDSRWHPAAAAGRAGVSDGSAVIVPLQPGLVAYAVSEARQDARPELEAALSSAQAGSQPPLALEGAAFRVVVTPDVTLRRRMVSSVPRQAASHALSIASLDARATAGDTLDGVIRLTMISDDAAAALSGTLTQLDQVLSTGLVAFLAPFLGDDASWAGKIPPFDVSREGRDVVVTISATPEHLRAILSSIPSHPSQSPSR